MNGDSRMKHFPHVVLCYFLQKHRLSLGDRATDGNILIKRKLDFEYNPQIYRSERRKKNLNKISKKKSRPKDKNKKKELNKFTIPSNQENISFENEPNNNNDH